MGLKDYISLIRLRYHINFVYVVIGALLFANVPPHLMLKPLLILYFSFNVLLYGGLYTINGIADVEHDIKHSLKKNRPLPSKRIRIKSAWVFAIAIILFGLGIAYSYFNRSIFYMHLLFLALNIFYTFVAKKIPYVEIIFNAVTHPLRVVLGMLLGNAVAIPYLLVFASFLLALGYNIGRRIVEKEKESEKVRPTLSHYTKNKLVYLSFISFILVLLLFLKEYPLYRMWYLLIITINIIFVLGIRYSRIKDIYVWTR